MEDKRRILEMVQEGILTPEEALELLSVIGEGSPIGERKAPSPPSEPEGFRIRVAATGANLEVVGVPGLPHPEAEGGTLSQEGGALGYQVSLGKGKLRVPEGAEVFLEARGSNVELRGVVLKGRALGANVQGERLWGLDLALTGGNLEAGLALREGEHGLEVQAGNAELRFLSGSDVEVEGEVRLGGLKVEGPWRPLPAPHGQRWVLGEGKAKLRARVNLGQLELEA